MRLTQLVVVLAFFAASAQDSPQSSEFKISTDVELVVLDVSARNLQGSYVSGLTKNNFRVYENGILQKITEFGGGDIPVTAGLVIDESGSMEFKQPTVISAGLAFVDASNIEDQIFVVNFNDTVRSGLPSTVPFTDNVKLLRSALSNNRPQGRTALYDAIAFALQHLQSGRNERKALVVISDGGDNCSKHSFNNLMRLIEESRVTIFTVGIFDSDEPDHNPHVLKRIAGVSGGESFIPGKPDQIVLICRKIAKDIRNRYTIGYMPVRGGDNARIRKLRVVASTNDREKLTIRTRTSYILSEPNTHAQSASDRVN